MTDIGQMAQNALGEMREKISNMGQALLDALPRYGPQLVVADAGSIANDTSFLNMVQHYFSGWGCSCGGCDCGSEYGGSAHNKDYTKGYDSVG